MCKQYDIITAFLQALLQGRTIYVEQPHGFSTGNLVCLLLCTLYGLKQSPLLWYEELTKFLKSIKFSPLYSDACVFRNHDSGDIIVIYVDDLIIIGISNSDVDATAKLLGGRFELKELGNINFYLGCRIVRDRKQCKIWIV